MKSKCCNAEWYSDTMKYICKECDKHCEVIEADKTEGLHTEEGKKDPKLVYQKGQAITKGRAIIISNTGYWHTMLEIVLLNPETIKEEAVSIVDAIKAVSLFSVKEREQEIVKELKAIQKPMYESGEANGFDGDSQHASGTLNGLSKAIEIIQSK